MFVLIFIFETVQNDETNIKNDGMKKIMLLILVNNFH